MAVAALYVREPVNLLRRVATYGFSKESERAEALIGAGHEVSIETGAGLGSGFSDEDYTAVGAKIAPDAATVWKGAEMIMKVKEPIPVEYPRIRENQLLFTYFHFAADETLTRAELQRRADRLAHRVADRDDACAALMRGVVQLPDYLERLQGGHRDIPIVLLPAAAIEALVIRQLPVPTPPEQSPNSALCKSIPLSMTPTRMPAPVPPFRYAVRAFIDTAPAVARYSAVS